MIFIMPKETAITLNTEFIMVKMFLAQEKLPCKKYSITFMDWSCSVGQNCSVYSGGLNQPMNVKSLPGTYNKL